MDHRRFHGLVSSLQRDQAACAEVCVRGEALLQQGLKKAKEGAVFQTAVVEGLLRPSSSRDESKRMPFSPTSWMPSSASARSTIACASALSGGRFLPTR